MRIRRWPGRPWWPCRTRNGARTPCGFVELRAGMAADEAELVAWCGRHLAGYKRPGRIVFQDLPRTSTGKVQKFALRAVARELAQEN